MFSNDSSFDLLSSPIPLSFSELIDSRPSSPYWALDLHSPHIPLVPVELGHGQERAHETSTAEQEDIRLRGENGKSTQKKRKGRRPKIDLGDDEEGKKAMRAERNRLFARQSRERKRKLIEDLKAELEVAKDELAKYKARFKKYERIEAQRDSSSCEIYQWLAYANKEMQSAGNTEGNGAQLMQLMDKAVETSVKERCKAIEDLTKVMLELAMPSIIRTYKQPPLVADAFTPKDLMRVLDNNISLEKANQIYNYIKRIYPSHSHYLMMMSTVEASKSKIKDWMKDLLRCQKKLQMELKKIYLNFLKSSVQKMQADAVEALADIVTYLSKKPECSNYAVYQIKEKDFSTDDQSVTEEASVIQSTADNEFFY